MVPTFPFAIRNELNSVKLAGLNYLLSLTTCCNLNFIGAGQEQHPAAPHPGRVGLATPAQGQAKPHRPPGNPKFPPLRSTTKAAK